MDVLSLIKCNSKVSLCGLEGSALAYVLAKISQKLNQPLFIIVSNLNEAQKITEALRFFLSSLEPLPLNEKVFLLPEEPSLPYTGVSPRPEVLGKQFKALFGLLNINSPVVVTTPKMLMSYFIPVSNFNQKIQIYQKGEEIPREEFIQFLQFLGYERLNLVEGVGEFSVRGEIIDIFCPLYKWPLRLEFLGDILESVRLFNPISQRSERHLNDFILIPANPIPHQEAAFKQAKKRIEALNLTKEIAQKICSFLEIPIHQAGIEDYFPLFYEKTETLFDYLPEKTIFCLVQPGQLEKTAHFFEKKVRSYLKELIEGKRIHLPFKYTIFPWRKIKNRLNNHKQILCYTLPFLKINIPSVQFKPKVPFAHLPRSQKQSCFKSQIEKWQKMSYSISLVASHPWAQQRLATLFETWHYIVPTKTPPFQHEPGISIYRGILSEGFILPEAKLVILGERDWQIRTKISVELPKKKELLPVSSFEDLKPGDFLVHVQHGIGCYQGLKTLTSGGITGEFLVIEYQDRDKLYLPIDRLHLVQKYKGIGDKLPSLDKLGGKTWGKTKQRVKKAIQKIAKELVSLYAKRLAQPGYAFSPPDSMFNQFTDSFPYIETPDQQRSIEEVLADMSCPRPMDRLICGDVGFGKTEVAMRAAFKAILDAKQVAVLVPTTILAEQHYLSFKQRFAQFPVNIACLSRFRSLKEQKQILEKLKKGEIDIIIGTHRILQKDVVFKDLGLVIVDEEHRFGVRQKEYLKKLKTSVDVITLSATPIPRTLYLSLLGIRDLSLIETPPSGRRPVKTYLAKFNPILLKDVISREMLRGGQVFFVHPRVRGLSGMARLLKRLLPQMRLGIAHGQMPEKQLEETMLAFLHHQIDLLLCTSIIESGLDIPNANTIIINRADMFGLAQLYHLRGRVGRAKEQAYAYLLVPGEKLITQEAQKRLRALLEHTELCSGYKLALHDLKLRGAGNILGINQSGHIAAVGYEMYLEILQKTIQELKGEPIHDEIEPEIKIPIMAYIPQTYISDQTQRVIFYKRLSQVRDLNELQDLQTEMKDRYGKLPQVVENLFQLIQIKIWCRRLAIKRLDTQNGLLCVYFYDKAPLPPEKIINFLKTHPSCSFTNQNALLIPLKKEHPFKKLKKTIQSLQAIEKVVFSSDPSMG